jgi:Tol biopolymer transport system component
VKRRLAFGVPATLVVVAAAAIAVVAWSTRDGSANGSRATAKIAFLVAPPAAGPPRPVALYVIDADGSNRRLVTGCGEGPESTAPYSECIVRSFAWSPDGRRLAFVRGTAGSSTRVPNLSLFVIDLDGKRERQLAGCGKPKWPSCGDFFQSQPAWSPDASRLVVPRAGVLYVFNVDRGGYRRLTPRCGSRRCYEMQPAWSPGGSTIVFRRMEAPRRRWLREFPLYSVKSDGSGLKKLTNLPGWTFRPAWSPDGRKIAFTVSDALGRGNSSMYSMAADGSRLTVLGSGQRFSGPRFPAWSPDGTEIVYLRTPIVPSPDADLSAEIWVMRADGTNQRRLYQSAQAFTSFGPTWSPEGGHIAFGAAVRGDEDDSGLFVMKADGTGLRRIAEPPIEAAWQPRP